MTTGAMIRKLRSEHKMSQQELADRAGVSFSFVNQVEGGKQTVRLDALNKLLMVFNYTMSPNRMLKPDLIEPEIPSVSIQRPKNDWSFFD